MYDENKQRKMKSLLSNLIKWGGLQFDECANERMRKRFRLAEKMIFRLIECEPNNDHNETGQNFKRRRNIFWNIPCMNAHSINTMSTEE